MMYGYVLSKHVITVPLRTTLRNTTLSTKTPVSTAPELEAVERGKKRTQKWIMLYSDTMRFVSMISEMLGFDSGYISDEYRWADDRYTSN